MSNSPGKLPSEQPSFEKRLPLALALMMLVLLASQYFFKPVPAPKPAVQPQQKVEVKPSTEAAPAATATSTTAPPAATVSAAALTKTIVDTDIYRVEFSNRGAVVNSWVLKKYQDNTGKPLELINPAAKDLPQPFSIDTNGQTLPYDPNKVLYLPKVSNDGLMIEFDYSDGKAAVHKSFSFGKDLYLTDIQSSVTLNGNPVPHFLTWRGGFGDQKIRNAASVEHTIYYDPSGISTNFILRPFGVHQPLQPGSADKKKDGSVTTGPYMFAGLEDSFFASVALAPKNAQVEYKTFADDLAPAGEEKKVPHVGCGIMFGPQNEFTLFTGPKDVDMLSKINPKLVQLVDWGTFGIIAKPLFLWLNWVHDHWTGNYGWAIILVTLIINLALFPLRLTSLKSARKMQKLQPEIKRLNEKYKNISISDPRKQEQNQEVMALYKREGVNPVGGCLPMILQLPFFYAFYRVLSIAIELRHAPWLWVTDLSSPESIALHVLPLVLVGTQFLSQRMTPAAGVDPAQQRMMMFMPLMFGFMFYWASAGLVLYWLTGNLVGIGQQLIINRFMPTAPPPPPPPKTPVKKVTKK